MDSIYFIAIFAAYFVKGVTGLGNTLVANSILSFRKNVIEFAPIDLLLGIPSNIYIVVREREHIDFKIARNLAILVVIGLIPGTLFLKLGNQQMLKVILGILVVLLAIEMLLREGSTRKLEQKPAVLNTIGILAGALCGLFGIGAFLTAYVSRTADNGRAFRGTLCVVFLIENIVRTGLYAATGILTLKTLTQTAILLPVMIVGVALGLALSKRVQEGLFKRVIIVLLILSGISLVITNLTQIL